MNLLDVAKGNTIAYVVNALGASLQGNENGLKGKNAPIGFLLLVLNIFVALLRHGGVTKLFMIAERPLLSVARRAMEVLHHICYSKDTWQLFYDAATL